MACTDNAPIGAADVAVSGGKGTRIEAYRDGIDLMQDRPDGLAEIYLQWDDVPRLQRALAEMMAERRAAG